MAKVKNKENLEDIQRKMTSHLQVDSYEAIADSQQKLFWPGGSGRIYLKC